MCRQADAAMGSRVKLVLEIDPWLSETRCVAAQAALHAAQVCPSACPAAATSMTCALGSLEVPRE